MVNYYSSNGIVATNPKDKTGISITYNGLLAKSGADTIYAVCGFGNDWTNESVIKMTKNDVGFTAVLPASKSDSLHVAFKDNINNWDNNNGLNYTFME